MKKIMKKMKDINYTDYKTLFRRRKVEKWYQTWRKIERNLHADKKKISWTFHPRASNKVQFPFHVQSRCLAKQFFFVPFNLFLFCLVFTTIRWILLTITAGARLSDPEIMNCRHGYWWLISRIVILLWLSFVQGMSIRLFILAHDFLSFFPFNFVSFFLFIYFLAIIFSSFLTYFHMFLSVSY